MRLILRVGGREKEEKEREEEEEHVEKKGGKERRREGKRRPLGSFTSGMHKEPRALSMACSVTMWQ